MRSENKSTPILCSEGSDVVIGGKGSAIEDEIAESSALHYMNKNNYLQRIPRGANYACGTGASFHA